MFYARCFYNPEQISIKTKILLKNYVDELICILVATRHALYCSGIADLDKLIVVHNTISEGKLFNNIKSIKKIDASLKIIHSGGFLPFKRQHVALAAAKLLKENKIDFLLYFY